MAGDPLTEAARALLESDALAHVATIDEDGSPHVTLAWVGVEGDEIVLATLPDQRKLRNLRRDPRVVLSVESTTTNEWGLLEYLVVYGTARVTEGGGAETLQRLAHTYLGPTSSSPTCPTTRPGSSRGSCPSGSAASGRGTGHAASERWRPRAPGERPPEPHRSTDRRARGARDRR